MAKPTFTQSAAGSFTISNYNSLYTYTATVTAGTVTISGSSVTLSNANSVATVNVSYARAVPATPGTVERKAYTYTTPEYDQSYNPNGDLNTNVNPNSWTCPPGWTAGGGAWGVGICRIYPGTTYKDSTPSGYTDSNGEWWKAG